MEKSGGEATARDLGMRAFSCVREWLAANTCKATAVSPPPLRLIDSSVYLTSPVTRLCAASWSANCERRMERMRRGEK